ncbi:MAG: hypothetical protein RBR74_06540 [Ignavibacteriaceae bacterium]|jgi:hypothetical protein|nr:hypothetical protein [Ignavibacteriaceae bacterium]
MARKLITLFLLFVIFISCASKVEKLQNIKTYVQEISPKNKYEDGFNTIKVIKEKRSIFRSYFYEDELVYINEELSVGNWGTSANSYFYKNNVLVYFTENSIFRILDSTGKVDKYQIKGSLYLDGDEILESERTKSNGTIEFSQEDVREIIEHSILLQGLAKKNRPRKIE